MRVDTSKVRYDLGGLPPDLLDYNDNISRFYEYQKQMLSLDSDSRRIRDFLWSLEGRAWYAAFGAWSLGRRDIAREWALKNMEVVEEIFFGEWQDRVGSGNYGKELPNREYWRRVQAWKSYIEHALLWGSVLGQWDRLAKITAYLPDDIGADIDQSDENRCWLLLLAGVVSGRNYHELGGFSQCVLNGKKVRERLLFWTLDAILEQASEQASDYLNDYTKRYFKVEYPRHDISTKIALDASVLVHWAEYSDVELQVPDKLEPHIVRLSPESAAA
ncbi:MAG: hypothetical protein AAGB29_06160 [Planctomycetota bacterium]